MAAFGRETTAEEVIRGLDLRGSRIVITGASSGLGAEAARVLAKAGADLLLGVRDPARGAAAAAGFGGNARLLPLDLSDLGSVRAFAAGIDGPIDVLIANAGVSKTPDSHLPNGLETRFATNHLGHFLLAHSLRPNLAERGGRIVAVSSAAHKGMKLRLDDLQWRTREHSLAAYGESKTANILFAQEATRRWNGDGIFANAVLPGTVMTGLQRYQGDEMKRRIGFILPDGTMDPAVKNIGQGAATIVWAAVAPELDRRGGLVLEDCAEALPVGPDTHPWSGYDVSVADPATAAALWDHSLALIERLGA